jgi:hypothetical protein
MIPLTLLQQALILHFFREVDCPASRTHVLDGEKYYECCHPNKHGGSHVHIVTKRMKNSYKRKPRNILLVIHLICSQILLVT